MYPRTLFAGNTLKRVAMITLSLLFSISIAFASGGGGGGNSGGSADHGPISYDVGKKLFVEAVVCDSCPFADLSVDSESVRAAWKAIKKSLRSRGEIGETLIWSERESVKRFIRKRFINADNTGVS